MEPKIFIENRILCLVIQSCTLSDRHTKPKKMCTYFCLILLCFPLNEREYILSLNRSPCLWQRFTVLFNRNTRKTTQTKYCKMKIISYKRQKPSENEAKRIENRNQIEREKHKKRAKRQTKYNTIQLRLRLRLIFTCILYIHYILYTVK